VNVCERKSSSSLGGGVSPNTSSLLPGSRGGPGLLSSSSGRSSSPGAERRRPPGSAGKQWLRERPGEIRLPPGWRKRRVEPDPPGTDFLPSSAPLQLAGACSERLQGGRGLRLGLAAAAGELGGHSGRGEEGRNFRAGCHPLPPFWAGGSTFCVSRTVNQNRKKNPRTAPAVSAAASRILSRRRRLRSSPCPRESNPCCCRRRRYRRPQPAGGHRRRLPAPCVRPSICERQKAAIPSASLPSPPATVHPSSPSNAVSPPGPGLAVRAAGSVSPCVRARAAGERVTPEKPVKQEEMAALDVDSGGGGGGGHGEYLQQQQQHGNGAVAAAAAQDTQPSPLALLAATCSKIGPPSPGDDEEEAAAAAGAPAAAGAASPAPAPSRRGTVARPGRPFLLFRMLVRIRSQTRLSLHCHCGTSIQIHYKMKSERVGVEDSKMDVRAIHISAENSFAERYGNFRHSLSAIDSISYGGSTGDLASAQLGGAPNRWEVLSATPTTIKDEAGNLVQIPSAATSSGQYVLPLQNLQNQQIFSVAPGSDSSNGTVSNVQYQVIPQIQSSDGQQVQIGFTGSSDNGGINQESGQIQIIPGSNQTLLASGTPPANIQNLIPQTGQVQVQGVAIGGSSFPGQTQVVANVPLGLPGNITFVPINSVDLDSLGLSGSSQTMTAGINADGHLINTGQAMDSSDNSERTGERVSPDINETNTETDLFVPTSSSSQLPVTIDSTGILQQNTNSLTTTSGQVHSSDLQGNYIQSPVSEETQAQNIQVSTAQPVVQHLQLQESQQPTSQAQIVQGITPQTIHGVQASGQNISQQALQNLQLQLNPGTFLIQAQTVTPSGQITWQTFQVQGVQNLQNLQIQNTAAQQITLTPVQTLTLGQVAAGGALTSTPVSLSTGQLPNLQTVTVNSIDSTGIQLHPGENADSPAGEFSKSCHAIDKFSEVFISIWLSLKVMIHFPVSL
ncbi:hypothetical protein EI555_016069, partial [Monodon monoceros]